MSDFFPISNKARELADNRQIDERWETVESGHGFFIPLNQGKLSNLRTKASTIGKRLNKEFVVVLHDEKGYEIARIK